MVNYGRWYNNCVVTLKIIIVSHLLLKWVNKPLTHEQFIKRRSIMINQINRVIFVISLVQSISLQFFEIVTFIKVW